MAAPMPTTTNTPTATPRIVSAARTLFERMASSAMPTPSKVVRTRDQSFMESLPLQGDNGIEPRGARRRIEPGHDPDAGANHDGHGDGPRRHRGRQGRERRHQLGQPD